MTNDQQAPSEQALEQAPEQALEQALDFETTPAFAKAIELAAQSRELLLKADELVDGDVDELLCDFTLPANIFARLVMLHLPMVESRMTQKEKLFWLEVGEALGPDWITSARKAVAWMEKAESFG